MVVDSSALMAIILGEPEGERCMKAIEAETDLALSAGTMAEALVVADRRSVGGEMSRLIEGLGFDIVPVTAMSASRVAEAYARWGKGVHPAGLNFGDCFAYVLAKTYACPLLFVGDDFSRTDVIMAA
jgi:ribonuclease VapC